jgi:hypothetical protein
MKYFKKFASAADAETFLEETDEQQLYIYTTNITATSIVPFTRLGNQVYYYGIANLHIQ